MIFINFIYFCRAFQAPEISNCKYTTFDEIMTILDVILLLCCIPVLIRGFKKGFLNQLFSIIALLAGVWTAYILADIPAQWFLPAFEGNTGNPEQMAQLAGFATCLVVTITGFSLLGTLLEKFLRIITPDWLDHILGVILSSVSTAILLGVLLLIFESLNSIYFFMDPKNEIFADSMLYPAIKTIAEIIFPFNNGMLI